MMPALSAQLACPADPWVAAGPANAAVVFALAPVTLAWSGGGTDTIPRHTPLVVAPGGGTAIDLTGTVGPYLVVAVKGANAAKLVPESDLAAMDATLGGGPTWAVIRRIFRVYGADYQQPAA